MPYTRQALAGIGAAVVLFATCGIPIAGEPALNLYVSPGGNDSWSGRLPSPNPAHTDGPFATIEHARDWIRNRTRAAGHDTDITVYLRGGRYILQKAVVFVPDDSGTAQHPITYANFGSEVPVLSGGRRITNWRRVQERLPGLPSSLYGSIWQADIPGNWLFNALFVNGRQWPRSALPADDISSRWPEGRAGAGRSLSIPPEFSRAVLDPGDAEINLTFIGASNNQMVPIAGANPDSGALNLNNANLAAGKSYRFRLENLPSGIQRPGSWYVDRRNRRVYCLPPPGVDLNRVLVEAPALTAAIELRGEEAAGRFVEFLNFTGLTVTQIDRHRTGQGTPPLGGFGTPADPYDSAILLTGVRNCSVQHCNVHGVGAAAIRVALYAQHVNLAGNEIGHCGYSGIEFHGYGPGKHNVNRSNIVSGNTVHDCGEVYWHGPGIESALAGDLTISGNRVYNLPYAGIMAGGQRAMYFRLMRGHPSTGVFSFRWNEIGQTPLTVQNVKQFVPGNVVIEGNVVHDVMRRLSDGGGIYLWASHNNVIRNNVVYRTVNDVSFGIYLDSEETGDQIENNLVYSVPVSPAGHGAALLMNQSGGNVVTNNIFALGRELYRFRLSLGGDTITSNIFMFLAPASGDSSPAPAPGPATSISAVPIALGPSVMDHNLFWSTSGAVGVKPLLVQRHARGLDLHSVAADPGFVDVNRFDFRLRGGSAAASIGFKPFPIPGS